MCAAVSNIHSFIPKHKNFLFLLSIMQTYLRYRVIMLLIIVVVINNNNNNKYYYYYYMVIVID